MVLGKILVLTGSVLVLVGLIVWGGAHVGLTEKLGKLPGDIKIEGKNVTFYFPLATSILISLLMSLVLYFWRKLR
ncbi:MAG: DUF2905 domain-containing protein [Proteobacteria bacterium]|nr:DUF2905 domain-containing protein [Pseudomonadota bacterium]